MDAIVTYVYLQPMDSIVTFTFTAYKVTERYRGVVWVWWGELASKGEMQRVPLLHNAMFGRTFAASGDRALSPDLRKLTSLRKYPISEVVLVTSHLMDPGRILNVPDRVPVLYR